MIKVKKIELQTVECFDPKDNSLGFLNQYEFTDLRVQIKENQISGYYTMFNNWQIFIDKNGELSDWPKGFFDTYTDLLMQLI